MRVSRQYIGFQVSLGPTYTWKALKSAPEPNVGLVAQTLPVCTGGPGRSILSPLGTGLTESRRCYNCPLCNVMYVL